MVSDFDVMLEKRKAEMSKRRRKKKDIDILNDNDDMISDMIRRMKEAAEVRESHVLVPSQIKTSIKLKTNLRKKGHSPPKLF